MEQMRILYIEDNPDDVRIVREHLSDAWDVVAATTYGEGVDLMRRESFDILLLDLSLPDTVSPEDTRQRARRDFYGKIPICILSHESPSGDLGPHIKKVDAHEDVLPSIVRIILEANKENIIQAIYGVVKNDVDVQRKLQRILQSGDAWSNR